MLYGLLRKGLPADLGVAAGNASGVLRTALDAAVAEGTVPETVDGRSVDTYLPGSGRKLTIA